MNPPARMFAISPPLLNSACPWATTADNLRDLYNTPHTGAITIRTSLLQGFPHDRSIHQYTFFSPTTGHSTTALNEEGRGAVSPDEGSSLNTLGYSPITLSGYLQILRDAAEGKIPGFVPRREKPILVSVTGTADEVAGCFAAIVETAQSHPTLRLAMEINLSCPNILNKPPPAYNGVALGEYLVAIAEAQKRTPDNVQVPVGIKTPPYTYGAQFAELVVTLEKSVGENGEGSIAFITATNTLGGCLVLNEQNEPALGSANGAGIGGMAGEALHPLALGNVRTIRQMLDASTHQSVQDILVIGVGGVKDRASFDRMKNVGAEYVAVATALGRQGIDVFARILELQES